MLNYLDCRDNNLERRGSDILLLLRVLFRRCRSALGATDYGKSILEKGRTFLDDGY